MIEIHNLTIQQIINTIGLMVDIIGVIMLFKYGLPSDLNKHGYILMAYEETDHEAIKKYKIYDFASKIALSLVIMGFLMQVLSTIWTSLVFA